MKHNPLLDELRAAFPPTPIDATRAFEERGRFYCDAGDYRRRLHGKTWEQLDPQFFARRTDGLDFLNISHLVAVLPLYLHLLIVFKPSSPVTLTLPRLLTKPRFEEVGAPTILTATELFELSRQFFEDLTKALSERQSKVIAATLRAFIAAAPNWAEQAQRALDRYWVAFHVEAP